MEKLNHKEMLILEQHLLEDRYHRANFWYIFDKETQSVVSEKVQQLQDAIADYADTEFSYKSKNDRYALLKQVCTPADWEHIAVTALKSLLLYQEMAPVHQLLNYIEKAVPDDITINDAAKLALDIVYLMGELDLAEGELPKDAEEGSLSIKSLIELDDETIVKLDALMYPLPMKVKPRELTKNTSSPYLTIKRDHVILGGKLKQHNKPVCLDVLNILNAQEMMIIPTDLPVKLEDVPEKERQIEALNLLGTRLVYIPWKYDMRGRIYSQGYHLNFQGKDLQKASYELSDNIHLHNNKS